MNLQVIRGAVIATATAVACLSFASPGRAATAELTIESAQGVPGGQVAVVGTVTCTQPTGSAHISITATQLMPFNQGFADLDVACGDGAVLWSTMLTGSDWRMNYPINIFAAMSDSHGGVYGVSGQWQT